MSWTAHGDWGLVVIGRVLVYRVAGAWNEEGTRAFFRASSRAAEPLAGQRWAILGDLTEWQLATPESVEVVHSLALRAIEAGCVAQCLMPGDGLLLRDCLRKMVPERMGQFERCYAVDFDQALGVLVDLGFADEAAEIGRRGLPELVGST